jgi:HSP20 family protein
MVETSHTAGWWPRVQEPLQNFRRNVAEWFAPPSDASNLNDRYEISVELPGVKPEDVDVAIHDNNLVIKGEKRFEHAETGRSYFFSEQEYGAFQRSFRLPRTLNRIRLKPLSAMVSSQSASESKARPALRGGRSKSGDLNRKPRSILVATSNMKAQC